MYEEFSSIVRRIARTQSGFSFIFSPPPSAKILPQDKEGDKRELARTIDELYGRGKDTVTNLECAERILRTIPAEKREEIPRQICQLLIKKGLSFAQAEALLELSKDLLKNAEI